MATAVQQKHWDCPQWFNIGGKALLVGVIALLVTKYLPLWSTAFVLEYVKLVVLAGLLVRSVVTNEYRIFTGAALASVLSDVAFLALLLHR